MDKKHSFFKTHFKFDESVNLSFLNTSLECPDWNDEDYETFEQFHFWICCVGTLSVSVIGILLNVIGIFLLSRRLSSHSIFNELIIMLLSVDSLYLFSQFVIKLMDVNPFNEFLSDIIVPVFVRPMSYLILTLSIFMILGVAHERSVAIRTPIIHRQSMLSSKYRCIALLKYMSFIMVFAISFNLPKFFERELHWRTPKVVSSMNNTNKR